MWRRIDMRLLFVVLGLVAIAVAVPAAQKAPAAKSAATATASAPVNLNTATQAQLESLPGIGPAAAQRILEYRQKNGSFKKIEELLEIRSSDPILVGNLQ
jgi:competence ComEA-like helix-hairpin-helix protein